MKHQYFGDINDFRKYGLIRGLTNFGDISTAVCWMLTPDEQGNVDGRKLSYLDNPSVYRHFDSQLFDRLHIMVKEKNSREVNVSHMSGILPNTHYVDMPVPATDVGRKAWLKCILEKSADADLLFFDPDNGMEVSSVRKGTKESPKYLYWDELAAAYESGQSILVYQHFRRIQRKEFIARLTRKAYEITGASAVFTYTTPHVVFLLLCQDHHVDRFVEANEKITRNWYSQIIVTPSDIPQRSIAEIVPSVDCPFCKLDNSRIILSNDHAIAIYDGYPVTLGHSLIIPKRHVGSFFETTSEERAAMLDLVDDMRPFLEEHYGPDGFNIGINDGAAAGQTIMHLHIHLMPRYAGDTQDPRGGVRWIMPENAPYWKRR